MKILDYIKNGLLLVIFLGQYFSSSAQEFDPEIENYSIEVYGADNQNWGIDVNNEGIIYIANNKGLLQYNGQGWRLFELPNKTIVRSVLCVDNRIYTGSYEEFGYWKKNDLGQLTYTSLTSLFGNKHKFKSDEFWQIVKHNKDIVFKSFTGVYKYSENIISSIPNSQDVSSIAVFDNKLIFGNLENGLQELINGKLVPYTSIKGGSNFRNVGDLSSYYGEKLFFFDIKKGGYIFDSKKLFQLPKNINMFLEKHILNKAIFLDANSIAFGTIKNGLLVYNFENQNIQYISKENGLHNNTVLGLKSHKGNLWCALDNGISRIDFDSPYLYYKDQTGTLGTVYDVAFFNNKFYLASNTGVYSFTNDNRLYLIHGSKGHVWNLTILDNQLFCSHNNGTYYIENDSFHRVDLSHIGIFGYFNIPDKKHWFLTGTYNGIRVLKNNNNKWTQKPIKNITFPVNNIVFESKFVIWVTHPYKGVYRIKLNKTYTEAIQVIYYGENKYLDKYTTKIHTISDTVVLYNSNRWFQYFKVKDSIGLYQNFQGFNGMSLIKNESNGSWFASGNKGNVITYINNKYQKALEIDAVEIKRRFVSKYEKVGIMNDSIRILNLNDGFAIFNINKLKKKVDMVVNSPVIDKIYSNKESFSINGSILHFPFKDAQYLTFEVYTPNLYENNHSYKLSGEIEQNELIKNGKFILQNLNYGDYILHINIEGLGGKPKEIKKIHFVVLPPWYLSWLMKIIYILLFIGVFFLVHIINKVRIYKQKMALKRMHIRKTKKLINQLEKQNLEKEINTKKKELINLTDSVIRKNETIMVMLNELERLMTVFPNLSKTKKILKISRKEIRGSNDWKIFESNFNELNQEFFKKLISMQPKLTTKDLRLCAYIKTGLTSKKIAPLMGISVRGIELHRYRLRKKLRIPANINLSNFLITF